MFDHDPAAAPMLMDIDVDAASPHEAGTV